MQYKIYFICRFKSDKGIGIGYVGPEPERYRVLYLRDRSVSVEANIIHPGWLTTETVSTEWWDRLYVNENNR